jgi:ParB family chromosome partitioning protein
VFWSRQIPIEVTDLTLTEEDRLRVWIYIHYKRKEWDAKEKETVAYGLVMGRASAANILGITVRELDKLVDVFEWSDKFTSLRDPSAAITWARELMVVGRNFLPQQLSKPSPIRSFKSQLQTSKTCGNCVRSCVISSRAHFLSGQGRS